MKVAVIGAGVAGLTAAWLLQDVHEVTLFEKETRLGGHVRTVAVPHAGGESVTVESGFEFFAADSYPTFTRLLRLLQVPLRRYPMTYTLYSASSSPVYLLPPKRDRPFWPALAPRSLANLLQLEVLLHRAAGLVERCDTTVTIDEFVAGFPSTIAFRSQFLYPLLIGGWGFPLAEFRRMAAYNVLKYMVSMRPEGIAPRRFSEICGGNAAYIAALREAMPQVAFRCGATIRQICRSPAGGLTVSDANGTQNFDHLVVATNARDACQLLHKLEQAEAQRAVLSQFRYFRTVIAVHGDSRFMPCDRRHWSVFNIRWSPERSLATVWKHQHARIPLFRSWLAPDDPPPQPLYDMTHYEHPAMDVEHFAAQRRLAALQGRDNLWFAGLYTHDIDSHESAVRSAVLVAHQLAPQSPKLALLQ